VLAPVSEHGRTDLALEIGGRMWRVQCKWGRLNAKRDVVIVHLFTSRCTANGYVRRNYEEHEIDLLAVYCGELDRCFLLPATMVAGKNAIQLRVAPPANGQRACINLAEDFDFEGAVAQLARAPAWHAGGQGFKSPQLHSTDGPPTPVGSNPFRDHLGYWLERASNGEELVVTFRGKPRVRIGPVDRSPALQQPLPLDPVTVVD
jgi:PD-(D/E)XK endonuclease